MHFLLDRGFLKKIIFSQGTLNLHIRHSPGPTCFVIKTFALGGWQGVSKKLKLIKSQSRSKKLLLKTCVIIPLTERMLKNQTQVRPMQTIGQILKMAKEEESPIVSELIDYIKQQGDLIQKLRDEIAELKGQKAKPKIKSSNLEKKTAKRKKTAQDKKRPGSRKKSKTQKLEIHEDKIIQPDFIPEGSEFKGYQDFIVQDFVIGSWNIRYRKARYKTPIGGYVLGKLPERISKSHFGPTLTAFILYQYYHSHVTQPLILEQLQEFNVNISSGQINRIITENKDLYHKEKEKILSTGLKYSGHINVDDTGARHNGENGYCTHIGNEFFAWFKSTKSKSRINFLELLQAGHKDYVINDDAIEYMKQQKLPQYLLQKFHDQKFKTQRSWQSFLFQNKIRKKRHKRIATEAALIGSLIHHGWNRNLTIVSDDAGQFNILIHALCWVHAERTVHKLIGFTEKHKELIKSVRSKIWKLYSDLKDYQQNPSTDSKTTLDRLFDDIFLQKTGYASLDQALNRIYKNKSELLLVLDRPDVPLHNNVSETDIREYVKRRKISGSTRSTSGRICRDTFTSIKKTCRKLRVSFWDYLLDRIEEKGNIPPLPELMMARFQAQTI